MADCLSGLVSSAIVNAVRGYRLGRVLAGSVSGVVGGVLFLVACGDRTGLLEAEGPDDAAVERAEPEAGPDVIDAPDAPGDVVFDIPSDVRVPSDCPDAAATLVYVITQDDLLYSFHPPTAAFSLIGTVACPGGGGGAFSMAVDRQGIAYVL